MNSTLRGGLPAILLPALFTLGFSAPAPAQTAPAPVQVAPPQGTPVPALSQGDSVCTRLEAQLAAFDRGGNQSRDDQVRKYEAAAQQQQGQIDRLTVQARRAGCDGSGGGFFSIFSSQPASCGPLLGQIKQMKGNLDRIEGDLARLQGSDSSAADDGQRRAIIGALAQNDCGAQYRQAAAQPPQQRGNLFESLFGPGTVVSGSAAPGESGPPGSGYRTVCVRMCDGYYYPISYSTSPAQFAIDEQTCQASCPAAEARLFMHRNPGEDINQAVSTSGEMYTALPNAFKYRQAFDNACTCKRSGESWSQALKSIQDPTSSTPETAVEGEKSKPQVDAQGRPLKLEIPPRPVKPEPGAAEENDEPVVVKRDPNKPIRQVGPTFIQR